jgi:hypothetical protein
MENADGKTNDIEQWPYKQGTNVTFTAICQNKIIVNVKKNFC